MGSLFSGVSMASLDLRQEGNLLRGALREGVQLSLLGLSGRSQSLGDFLDGACFIIGKHPNDAMQATYSGSYCSGRC